MKPMRELPTQEDRMIFKRNIERIIRWCDEGGVDAITPMRKACGDYLHYDAARTKGNENG